MVYIVDPYHIFHETRWNKNLWFGSQTLINLGQIETYLKRSNDYDGILVGSSHSMNFKGSDLAKAVGAKGVLKLCGDGMTSEELQVYYEMANRSHRVPMVIFGIDHHKFFRMDRAIRNNMFFMEYPYLYPFTLRGLGTLIPYLFFPRRNKSDDRRFWTWTDLDSIHSWFPYQSDRFPRWIWASNLAGLKKETPDFSDWRIAQRVNESTSQRHYTAHHTRTTISQVFYITNPQYLDVVQRFGTGIKCTLPQYSDITLSNI